MCRKHKSKKKKINPDKTHQTYIRFGIVPIDVLFKDLEECEFKGDKVYDDEYTVKMSSKRYKTFYHKGTTCLMCGLKGEYFALEKFSHVSSLISHRSHFNLYGRNEDGHEILFTKDHIIPISKGGTDDGKNLQTLCSKCNCLKGDRVLDSTLTKSSEILTIGE